MTSSGTARCLSWFQLICFSWLQMICFNWFLHKVLEAFGEILMLWPLKETSAPVWSFSFSERCGKSRAGSSIYSVISWPWIRQTLLSPLGLSSPTCRAPISFPPFQEIRDTNSLGINSQLAKSQLIPSPEPPPSLWNGKVRAGEGRDLLHGSQERIPNLLNYLHSMLLYFQHSLPTTLYFYGDACLLFCFERALTITYTLAAALRSPFSLIQGCLTRLVAPRSC